MSFFKGCKQRKKTKDTENTEEKKGLIESEKQPENLGSINASGSGTAAYAEIHMQATEQLISAVKYLCCYRK